MNPRVEEMAAALYALCQPPGRRIGWNQEPVRHQRRWRIAAEILLFQETDLVPKLQEAARAETSALRSRRAKGDYRW